MAPARRVRWSFSSANARCSVRNLSRKGIEWGGWSKPITAYSGMTSSRDVESVSTLFQADRARVQVPGAGCDAFITQSVLQHLVLWVLRQLAAEFYVAWNREVRHSRSSPQ